MDRFAIFTEAAKGLATLEHVYDYVTANNTGTDQYDAQREIIRAQSAWRASIANAIHGKASLPHPGWGLKLEDFAPTARIFFSSPMIYGSDECIVPVPEPAIRHREVHV